MKLRIKFTKSDKMVYVGHLDILRFFQKAIRRAKINIKYSNGFSPHQIMSFASPLGIGVSSMGDYMDIEVNSYDDLEEMKDKLNQNMPKGISILNVTLLPDNSNNAMAQVAIASYLVTLKSNNSMEDVYKNIPSFLALESIMIEKVTKKNTLLVDIRPGIIEFAPSKGGIYMMLDASSGNNIKPLNALKALYDFSSLEFNDEAFRVCRLETYLLKEDGNLASLDTV